MISQTIIHRQAMGRQSGMSLIEILIVFVIASIVAMVSMPLYQNYSIRTKISSEIPLMHPLMMIVNEEYAINNRWPTSNEDAGAKQPTHYKGKYLVSVAISDTPQDATMTLTYDAAKLPALRGTDTIVFYPNDIGIGAKWKCDQGTMPSKYRPSECL